MFNFYVKFILLYLLIMTKLNKNNKFDVKGFNDLFLKENIEKKKKSIKLEKNYLKKLNKKYNKKKKKRDITFYYYQISKILLDLINNISNIKKFTKKYNYKKVKNNFFNNLFHFSIIIITFGLFCLLLS